MAFLVQSQAPSAAWVAAMDLLLAEDGKAVNLNVAFPASAPLNAPITERLDAFIRNHDIRHSDGNLLSTGTVANTLFPSALYHPHLGKDAAARLYENYQLSMILQRRGRREKDTYFSRMIAYPVGSDQAPRDARLLNADGTWNQLAYYIDRLKNQRQGQHLSSSYEIGVSHPIDGEIRVQAPLRDKRTMGFPCLSHLSLTLVDDVVHMTATYRNQSFISRAYGNYLGLARLLRFIAAERGAACGELQVVATHADAEFSLGKGAISDLVESCRSSTTGAYV